MHEGRAVHTRSVLLPTGLSWLGVRPLISTDLAGYLVYGIDPLCAQCGARALDLGIPNNARTNTQLTSIDFMPAGSYSTAWAAPQQIVGSAWLDQLHGRGALLPSCLTQQRTPGTQRDHAAQLPQHQ